MIMLRTLLLTSALAGALALAGAVIGVASPASAGNGIAVLVEVAHRDRDRNHDDYRYRREGNHYGQYKTWRKVQRHCFTGYDVSYRFGHRVRVVKRICFDRFGRPYVASRHYVRIGARW